MKSIVRAAALITAAAASGVAFADDVAQAAPVSAAPFHISGAQVSASPVTVGDYVVMQQLSQRTGVVEILSISLSGQPIETAVQGL